MAVGSDVFIRLINMYLFFLKFSVTFTFVWKFLCCSISSLDESANETRIGVDIVVKIDIVRLNDNTVKIDCKL